jgi:hypothetical protein
MYLFAESHDCEGANPALKTKFGEETSEVCSDGSDAVFRPGEFAAGTAGTALCSACFGSFGWITGDV